MQHLVSSAHKDEIAARFGPHLLELWACKIASYDPVHRGGERRRGQGSRRLHRADLLRALRVPGRDAEPLAAREVRAGRGPRHAATQAARLKWDWFGENAEALDHRSTTSWSSFGARRRRSWATPPTWSSPTGSSAAPTTTATTSPATAGPCASTWCRSARSSASGSGKALGVETAHGLGPARARSRRAARARRATTTG